MHLQGPRQTSRSGSGGLCTAGSDEVHRPRPHLAARQTPATQGSIRLKFLMIGT